MDTTIDPEFQEYRKRADLQKKGVYLLDGIMTIDLEGLIKKGNKFLIIDTINKIVKVTK